MEAEQIARINSARLAGWAGIFDAQQTTAVLLLGVHQDAERAALRVCVTEDVSAAELRDMVRFLYHAVVLGREYVPGEV